MLFERKIPFRHDWEKVITPIIDFLVARKDVDAARIALSGWSFGGSLVTRAAAFEPRLAAVCADPGFVSIWDAWPIAIRQLAATADQDRVNALWAERFISNMTPEQRFTVAKRAEIFGLPYLEAARAGRVFSNLLTLAETLKAYDIAAIAPKVRTPMLVTEYEREGFVPGGGRALFDLLTCPKTLRVFTTAEGASEHCAPLAPQLRNSVIFDWLASTLNVH
jgi:cephalosporin-C deacetylase-like acetyl esterase